MADTDVVQFLAARYAEDWAVARDRELAAGPAPTRATRDIDAKREVLAWHAAERTCSWVDADGNELAAPDESGYGCPTLLILAAVYNDHPDWDPAWRL